MTDKLKIEKLYCFIAEDETGEGVTGFYTPTGWMPLIGADMRRVDDLMNIAQSISNLSSKKITLCEFDNRREVKVILPESYDSEDTTTTPQEDAAFKSHE